MLAELKRPWIDPIDHGSINVPEILLFGTSLSFLGLGLGIRPPKMSLGRLLGDGRETIWLPPGGLRFSLESPCS